jgi:hypothetical protein
MVANPLLAAPALRREAPKRAPNAVFTLVMDADGDVFWLNKASGECQWELPKGADTADGWRYVRRRGRKGFWQRADTGEIATHRKAICERAVVERLPGAEARAAAEAPPAAGKGSVSTRMVFLPQRAAPLGASAAPEEAPFEKAEWYSPKMKASDFVNALLAARREN